MGVTQLWSVVQPCARPIKIETLNKKRLAVDSSLWIYQFLKAVRDKEGNALRNSHVVGFYRRICKLLYLGIKPVFVFDGGAPALKRQTIAGRKSRREGRREDAVRTAGKLLALQMQRRAEEQDQQQRQAAARPVDREEEEVPDNPVYVDEIQMTQQERQQNRKFKKKDQYDLPDLDVSLAEMGQPNDPRVMSIEELEQYARQFDSSEDINVYDFSKIDFDSPFFLSLPPSDRYNILNAARLRSRLRMGLSKDQLDDMFPDRMAFSRFQIDRVKERNELTQRLMHVNGMSNDPMFGVDGTGRIAGEKGREYVLVKNTGVEGGWALGVIDKDEGDRNKPIDVDEIDRAPKMDQANNNSESEEEDAFEDVPIEGLNRLPKLSRKHQVGGDSSMVSSKTTNRPRRATYQPRNHNESAMSLDQDNEEPEDPNSLFVGQTTDLDNPSIQNTQDSEGDDEDELQRAIAMSLENGGRVSSPEDDDLNEAFDHDGPMQQGATNRSQDTFPPGPAPFADDSNDEDEIEFENVLPISKTPSTPFKNHSAKDDTSKPVSSSQSTKFGGPLPFESLDLGSSILGKKKMKKIQEDAAGGFERDLGVNKRDNEPKPLPPWFSEDLMSGMKAQDRIERVERAKEREADKDQFLFPQQPKIQKEDNQTIIDVDAIDETKEPITVESSDEDETNSMNVDVIVEDPEVRMGDIADLARAEPPKADEMATNPLVPTQYPDPENVAAVSAPSEAGDTSQGKPLDWEASDEENQAPTTATPVVPAGGRKDSISSRSPSLEFEQVTLEDDTEPVRDANVASVEQASQDEGNENIITPASGVAEEATPPPPERSEDEEDQYYSEVEDEELMLQLATEAEEHARFASTLNQKTTQQNIEEYERELKALRTQQKKDRRDADEVTQVMITECQQLLKLFGLPYITAPMEAEAQCAELVSLGLVDGIVTDDSDVFLFGGTRIYKNMFNQAKYVECYLGSDLQREFDLTRDKLIRIAHLLGSDYTEGLPGIGPVTALEIISEFPEGLQEFKEWWAHVQKGAKPSEQDLASTFRKKFRRNAGKLFLPPTFPDARVDEAYLHPEVDSDPSAFQWGVPDLDALRAFLMATIGWSPERTDEVLVPVIRDMNRRETEGTQANITKFITGSSAGAGSNSRGGGSSSGGAVAFAPRRRDVGKSKRMEGALEKLAERARKKRKAAALGEDDSQSKRDLAAEQDRAVQADEALIAVSGSAVDGSPASKSKAKQTGNASSKRKVAVSRADQDKSKSDSEAEMSSDRPKQKKKKQAKKKTR